MHQHNKHAGSHNRHVTLASTIRKGDFKLASYNPYIEDPNSRMVKQKRKAQVDLALLRVRKARKRMNAMLAKEIDGTGSDVSHKIYERVHNINKSRLQKMTLKRIEKKIMFR